VGAIGVGFFTKFGKKNCILFANILVILGAGITTNKSIVTIVVGRFIYGLATGSFSVLVPGFINETAPTELKGPLGALTQILITVGIMISFFLGIPIPDIKFSADGKYYPDGSIPGVFINRTFESDNYWRIMFSLPIAFSLL